MALINKGTIAAINGHTARVVPTDDTPTVNATVPQSLEGSLKKGDVVVYIEFDDFTALLLDRADGEGGVYIELDKTLTLEGMAAEAAAVGQRFGAIERTLAALYKPIEITKFSLAPNVAEIGSTVTSMSLTWEFSKIPESIELDGAPLSPDSPGTTLSGLRVTERKKWTLKATDEKDATDTDEVWLNFYNGVYYGVMADGAVIDSDAVLALSRKLQSGLGLTFTANAGASQRIAYAAPAGRGTPVFAVGLGEGGFHKAATIQFENRSEYTETYDVWLSNHTGLGSTTVTVK